MSMSPAAHIPAIVARPASRADERESYLLLTPLGPDLCRAFLER